jgi:hypothetical protein
MVPVGRPARAAWTGAALTGREGMKHKLFAVTLAALAAFIGYLAHAGFPTIVPLMAASSQSARASIGDCEPTVALAEAGSDLADLRRAPPGESVGSTSGWLLDPRPMMGRSDR